MLDTAWYAVILSLLLIGCRGPSQHRLDAAPPGALEPESHKDSAQLTASPFDSTREPFLAPTAGVGAVVPSAGVGAAAPSASAAAVAPPVAPPRRLEGRIRASAPPAQERHTTPERYMPRRVGDGWLTPDGARITHTFDLEWTRPRELEGEPITVFFAESEAKYWLHEGFLTGGISNTDFWYGPYYLR